MKKLHLRKQNNFPRTNRIIPRDGIRTRVKRSGIKKFSSRDIYIHTLNASWPKLIALMTVLYILLNAIFANLYLLVPNSIENARAGSFTDAFFFSVQTMATIGYGKLVPLDTFANIMVTIEALIGLGGLAVATGILFAKLSKPTARVLFSKVAVIGQLDGAKTFIFRLANERSSRIVDPSIKVVIIRDEVTVEGHKVRRIHDLELVRNFIPVLLISWSVYHKINKESPLYAATPESLKANNTEIIVSLNGLDETLSQIVHSQHSYIAEEILCSGYFVDIINRDASGRISVDYKKFHEVVTA